MIVAALLSSFLFIQKIFFHDSGISTIFSTLYEINSASLWYFFRYNNFSSNTLSCLPSLNLSKNPIKISLSVHLSLAGQSVQRLGGVVMPPALGQNVPAGARPVKADSIVPSPAGNGKSLTAPCPCPGAGCGPAPAGGGRCPRWISPGTASSGHPGWACIWRSPPDTPVAASPAPSATW